MKKFFFFLILCALVVLLALQGLIRTINWQQKIAELTQKADQENIIFNFDPNELKLEAGLLPKLKLTKIEIPQEGIVLNKVTINLSIASLWQEAVTIKELQIGEMVFSSNIEPIKTFLLFDKWNKERFNTISIGKVRWKDQNLTLAGLKLSKKDIATSNMAFTLRHGDFDPYFNLDVIHQGNFIKGVKGEVQMAGGVANLQVISQESINKSYDGVLDGSFYQLAEFINEITEVDPALLRDLRVTGSFKAKFSFNDKQA